MRFQELAVPRGAREFHAQRSDLAVGPTAVDGQNPGQDEVNHNVGLDFLGLGVDELNGGFVAGSANADFFGASELLVTGDTLEGVVNGAAANDGDRAGLAAFEAGFGAELEADGRIGADLADGAPEREEFGGGGVDFLLQEEGGRPSGSAEHRRNGDLVFAQPRKPDAGHLEFVGGDFVCSHGCTITMIGNASLADYAKLLAKGARLQTRASPKRQAQKKPCSALDEPSEPSHAGYYTRPNLRMPPQKWLILVHTRVKAIIALSSVRHWRIWSSSSGQRTNARRVLSLKASILSGAGGRRMCS